MKNLSISFCKGKGCINHNNRVFIYHNVDKNRTSDNIIYKQENLKEAYKKLFEEAINEYNNKQKRSDRKIAGVEGYIKKIKNSGNGEKLFYELIIQIGDIHTCPTQSAEGEQAKIMLDKYMQDFQKRNPNLYVFNAVMHLDEATPHLHIDYIPIGTGYKQGLKCRNALDKALKCQGIEGLNAKHGNSTQKWQKQEREILKEIVKNHGHELEEERGTYRDKLSVKEYKTRVEIIKNEVTSIPSKIEAKNSILHPNYYLVEKEDFEKLKKRARLKELLAEYKNILKEKIPKEIAEKYQKANERLLEASETKKQVDEELKRYKNLYAEQIDLNKLYRASQNKNSELKAKISELEGVHKKTIDYTIEKHTSEIEAFTREIEVYKSTIQSKDEQISTLKSKISILENYCIELFRNLCQQMHLSQLMVQMNKLCDFFRNDEKEKELTGYLESSPQYKQWELKEQEEEWDMEI